MPDGNESLAMSIALAAAFSAAMLALLVAAGAFGDGSPRAPDRFGAAACSEWTDGCIVCARTSDGLACSTPGIACTRGAGRCLKP